MKRITCFQCGNRQDDEWQNCQACLVNLHQQDTPHVARDHRFGWLLSEKKWHQDIESRRIAPDGSSVRVPLGKKARWDR